MIDPLADFGMGMVEDVEKIDIGKPGEGVFHGRDGLGLHFIINVHPVINIAVFVRHPRSVRPLQPEGVDIGKGL